MTHCVQPVLTRVLQTDLQVSEPQDMHSAMGMAHVKRGS